MDSCFDEEWELAKATLTDIEARSTELLREMGMLPEQKETK